MRQRLFLRLATFCVLASSLVLARAQFAAVRINEVLADNTLIINADGRYTDLVEFYNTGLEDQDIGGGFLSDSNTHPTRFTIPPGTVVPAGGYLVFAFDSVYSNAVPGMPYTVPFGIKASGGFLHFYDPSQTPIDSVEYGLQLRNRSIVRTGPTTWTLGMPTLGGINNSNVPLGTPFSLRINEWLADQSGSGPDDYFEIYNTTNRHVPMGGMFLSDSNTTFPTLYEVAPLSFIGTGELAYAVFIADSKGGTVGTTNRYPADHVNFGLRASGESFSIFAPHPFYTEIHRVTYGNQQANVSEGYLPDGNTNVIVRFPKINDYETRSPGDPNFLIVTNVYVNELLSHTDPPQEDVVEFHNRAATNVNISGWWMSNARGTPKKYLIPPGPDIPPGGFRLIYEGTGTAVGFNSFGAAIPFTFNSAHGDNIVLSQVDAGGNLTGHRIYESFEAAANGISFGYYKTSVPNDYKFVAMAETTFGQDEANTLAQFRLGTGKTNLYPKIGPLVINEVMFAPSNTIYFSNSLPVFGQNPIDEFIELRNVTSLTVPLYDPLYPTNHWKLQKAVSFIFPLTNMPPNSFCLVVGFDPYTNTTALADFRAHYGVSPTIPIFGPWTGRLSDSGDSVELYKPDPVQLPPAPDAGFVPYIRVDKVNYNSAPPWPGGANATGKSLQRKNSLFFGNDPINWAVDAPTAGEPSSSALLDTDGDGIPDAWEQQYGFSHLDPADAGNDPDNDKTTNLAEYVAGTNPTNAASVLRVLSTVPSPDQYTPAYITFFAYTGATYTVEYRKSLQPSSNWKKVEDVPSGPSRWVTVTDWGATNSVISATNGSDRYYRVVAPSTN
jgi:hypothetical protein